MHQNGEFIGRLYGAFEAADLDTIREAIAEDAVLTMAGRGPIAGVYKGRDDILGFLAELVTRSDGTFKAQPHDILADDDHVVVLSEITASRGSQQLDDRGVEIFHVSGDKVTEAWFTGIDLDDFHEFFS